MTPLADKALQAAQQIQGVCPHAEKQYKGDCYQCVGAMMLHFAADWEIESHLDKWMAKALRAAAEELEKA